MKRHGFILNDITNVKKILCGSLLKPKPILRIGISEHAPDMARIFATASSAAIISSPISAAFQCDQCRF
jgi:hypothetical protein